MNTEAKVRSIIVEQLNVNPEMVTPEATLESMGADSLDLAELSLAVEHEMDVLFSDEEWNALTGANVTVGYLVNAIQNKLASI